MILLKKMKCLVYIKKYEEINNFLRFSKYYFNEFNHLNIMNIVFFLIHRCFNNTIKFIII